MNDVTKPTGTNSPDGKTLMNIDDKKSRVRVWVTYWAAAFLFGIGPILIFIILFVCDDKEKAIDLFQAILPVSAGIIAFWFAGRGTKS